MLFERPVKPAHFIVALVAIFYGVMIYAELVGTLQWLAITGIILIVLLIAINSLGYPLSTLWPIFVSCFLIIGASVALYQGIPTPGPLTQTRAELVVPYLLAGLYLVWAVRSTKNALEFVG